MTNVKNSSAQYIIILFYKYVHIKDPQMLAKEQRGLCERLGLTGRCIVAGEGINATFEGTPENIEKYVRELGKDPRLGGIHFKYSRGTGSAFPKLSIKVRGEIVSLHLGVCDIDPNKITGIRLEPEELHQWILEKREFYIVDMRNAYEHKVGYFENSILPPMENFRDLPKAIRMISHLKDKVVVTVCTGGVRCEKASGFLLTQGFQHVYQLDGGIVSYMSKYPNENFKGKLYVFDNRVVMTPSLNSGDAGVFYTDDPKHTVVGKCENCTRASENYVNCANSACHRHFIVCRECLDKNHGWIFCPLGCFLSRHGRKVSPIDSIIGRPL